VDRGGGSRERQDDSGHPGCTEPRDHCAHHAREPDRELDAVGDDSGHRRRCRSAAGRRGRRSAVLDREDDHAVFVLEEGVHDDHPAPRTEQETGPRPAAAELRPEPGESLQQDERSRHALFGVRQAVRTDERGEILDCGFRDLYSGHGRSEVGERDGSTLVRLLESELRPLESAVDAVQELDHMARVGIGLLECA